MMRILHTLFYDRLFCHVFIVEVAKSLNFDEMGRNENLLVKKRCL